MRNKDITAKEVCVACWNTGTIVIKGRNYSYSVPCVKPVETEQPQLPSDDKKQVEIKEELSSK